MLFIFDLDGTLITSYMDAPDRDFHTWQMLPGRQQTIARLIYLGNEVAVVTNQAGVAFRLITEQDVIKKFGRAAMALGFASISIHDGGQPMNVGWNLPTLNCFVCYNDTRSKNRQYQDASRRKPSGAMIREAVSEFPAAAEDGVLMVGDRPEDEGAARDAGVGFVWADRFFGG